MIKMLRQIIPQRLRRAWHRPANTVPTEAAVVSSSVEDSPPENSAQAEPPPNDLHGLVAKMLADRRYALLLRPQIARNLTTELYEKARAALEDDMGIVPAGDVHLEPSVFDVDFSLLAADDPDAPKGLVIPVQSVFLDRYPVTNQKYHQFITGGGYQEMAIWDHEIWPAVLDFVDSTGFPGPRSWKKAHYPPGEAHLPVVGITWYEATAYARWVGKRLPTDAEWVKSGSWPVTLSPGALLQRKFPWGDSMDRRKANVWGSGAGRVVPVDEFTEGVSVGGLYQLIGNVWEWTASSLDVDPTVEEDMHGKQVLLKSIRGGAFDTYFENQANCQFASGENPISRKHNIGFRCALSVCDISGPPGERSADEEDPVHKKVSGRQPDSSHESANRAPPVGELQHDPAAEEALV
jgi:gamma-glutamyl hercynylcysteine S-oxide synthase